MRFWEGRTLKSVENITRFWEGKILIWVHQMTLAFWVHERTWDGEKWTKFGSVYRMSTQKIALTGYPLYLDKHLQEQLFLAIYIYLYDLWRLCTSPLNQGFLQGYSTLWWILAMGLADLLWIADLHCRKVSKYQMVKTQTESHDWRSIVRTNLWQIWVSF